jgi:hypothetical protein
MSSGFESAVHALVYNQNKVIHVTVTAHYPNSPTPGPVVAAEGFIPTSVSFTVKVMRVRSGGQPTDAGSWEDDPSAPVPPTAPVTSNPPMRTPLGIETLNTATRDDIVKRTGASDDFAGAIVMSRARLPSGGYGSLPDFTTRMAGAAASALLATARYSPTQPTIDRHAALVAAKLNADLTWK